MDVPQYSELESHLHQYEDHDAETHRVNDRSQVVPLLVKSQIFSNQDVHASLLPAA